MKTSRMFVLLGATAITLSMAAAAGAGGFSRGTADTDILFEDGNFNIRTSMTYVSPTRKYSVNRFNPELVGVDYADSYVVPSAAVKFNILEDLRCAGTYTQSFGGAATWPTPSGLVGKLDEDFHVNEFGATCGYKFDVGKGRLWVLGGAFVEKVDYQLIAQPVRLGGTLLDGTLTDTNVGWRAGLAYEIPDIALRAQIMYRSGFDVEATGSAYVQAFGTTLAAEGTANLPQSVEMKFQTGVAPGWLAYGSVKWMDWSVTQELILDVPGTPIQSKNEYFWRDGWTVTGGIGHAFTDKISGTAFVSWDRGVGTGWDLTAETYTVGVGASLKDKFGELRVGAAAIYQGDVSETQYTELFNRSVDADWGYALTAGYAIKW
ncbi:outer membrane protein transport protein [Corticibacterium sp. UT-5YL-CI-8]|nr:outer membrane protein transport protein [Tianweitania sp. UT-5YL-CI-8]